MSYSADLAVSTLRVHTPTWLQVDQMVGLPWCVDRSRGRRTLSSEDHPDNARSTDHPSRSLLQILCAGMPVSSAHTARHWVRPQKVTKWLLRLLRKLVFLLTQRQLDLQYPLLLSMRSI